MRTFDHPNVSGGWRCPICGTSDDKPVVLIGIDGTQEGGIMQANQYHLDCIDLAETRNPDGRNQLALVMFFQPKEGEREILS
jgi:hypothetical protein